MSINPARAEILNLSSITELNQLVEGGMMHDWILSIEHYDPDTIRTRSEQWQPWGESLWRIADALPVIDGVAACHACYPKHLIRLHAQMLKPRVQMFYHLYSPEQHEEEERILHHADVVAVRISEWLSSFGNAARTFNGMVLRVITIAGMLLATLLMLEEAMA